MRVSVPGGLAPWPLRPMDASTHERFHPDPQPQESHVAIDQRLMDILVCPDCHGKVEHKERRNLMVCISCGLRFPVRDGIPVMLVEEATKGRPG